MRGRGLLFISIGLNVALAAGLLFYWRARNAAVSAADSLESAVTNKITAHDRVIPVYRKQFFAWSELESTNYDTYIANLRDIMCPEETIHDIILADVNKLYDERKTHEDQTPEHFKSLDDERHALLNHLLGADWDKSEQQTGFAFSRVAFTDPLLDELTPELRAKVQDILTRWSQQAGTDKQQNAQLEQKMRFELSGVLSPAQMEELLSRYSANANELNKQLASLQYFKATPEEYHQLFRATDAIDLQLRLLGDATDASTTMQRNNLMQQRDLAVKTALGPKRYADYIQLQDSTYRDALAQTQASGAPAATVRTLQQINQQTAIENAIAQADPSLTETQRAIQLKQIELEQMKAQAQAEGHDLSAITSPPPRPPTPPQSFRPYNIDTGDTLDSLAQRYHVSVNDIQSANPNIDLSTIRIGQRITMPVGATQ